MRKGEIIEEKHKIRKKERIVKQFTIFLDMDEVLADFVGACIKRFGAPDVPTTTWEMHEWWGIDHDVFWNSINDEDFWTNIPPIEGWHRFFLQLSRLAPTYVVTNAMYRAPHSFSGKIRWIHRYIGTAWKDYIITPHKHLLAHEYAILIDDYPENVKAFTEAGGHGILFPRNHNIRRTEYRNHSTWEIYDIVLAEVQKIMGYNPFQMQIKDNLLDEGERIG